ncbi:MAG: methionyl-tRNA formyltransferase [Verrucomicrobiota bacterium]|nr:methionyl-tRNA formyltransferase [Verrucomicrobiota bacterium]
MDDLRILFFGTPEIACPVLNTLLESKLGKVVAVVTQPDKQKGRDLQLQPPPVKELAQAHGIPVLQPVSARDAAFINSVKELQADLMIVIAYGQILPQSLLDISRHGALNIHTSLLPKYRGAAPIQHAVLNGDRETGVTIMKMDAGMDTGPIVSMERVPISENDTAATLHDTLGQVGANLLVETIPGYVRGEIKPVPQPEGATYAGKIRKEAGRINWSDSAESIGNRIRAFNPWPGTFTTLRSGEKSLILKIWKATQSSEAGEPGKILRVGDNGILVGCGKDSLRILELQKEGGKRLSVAQFLAGNPMRVGEEFIHG